MIEVYIGMLIQLFDFFRNCFGWEDVGFRRSENGFVS